MKLNFDQFSKIDLFRYPRASLAVVIAVTGSLTYAQVCPPQYQEQFVEPAFNSATQALNNALKAVDKSLSAEMKFYHERMTSAIAVLTKQKALAANQIGDANHNASQQTAVGLKVLAETRRVKEARFEFSHEFGQGYSPCLVYPARTALATRADEMGEERRLRVMSEIAAGPGKYADPNLTRAAAAKEHRDLFCTADQVKSGMCPTVGPMAGASLTAATLFKPVMETDALYKAKLAFVNNVAGPPDAPVPVVAAKTPAAVAYSLAKAQKDALLSPALTSLKEVQLDYTGVETAHSGSDVPMSTRLNDEVKRYLGNTPEHDKWSSVMVGQNSRGLMVEMLKVKALDLVLLERQYRQYERMEANLATLVASQLRGQAASTAAAAATATRQQVTSQIK